MNPLVQALRVCAFCPNTCREHWPAEAPVQPESRTPSSLALLALAVAEGRWPLDGDVRQALGQREMAIALRPHCSHKLDVLHLLDQVLDAQRAKASAPAAPPSPGAPG